jgi:hypothetical protein
VSTQSTGATATNSAPTVSGTPASEIPAGFPYVFKPTVTDAEGDPITFTVKGMPSWATFQTSTGELRGTPSDADVGETVGIVITASDGRASTAFGPFAVRVKRPAGGATRIGARPPSISGSPATTVVAGTGYTFQAIAADPDGDRLTFGASNLPSWLGINTANGLLTGTPSPAQVGAYVNITISVTDGNSTVSLPAFTITVTAPVAGNGTTTSTNGSTPTPGSAPTTGTGTATLSWQKPTQNSDGSPLLNLAGYIVKYGTSPSGLTQRVAVTDPDLTRYTVQNLGQGTWYFTAVSYTTGGLESDIAPTVSKTIY